MNTDQKLQIAGWALVGLAIFGKLLRVEMAFWIFLTLGTLLRGLVTGSCNTREEKLELSGAYGLFIVFYFGSFAVALVYVKALNKIGWFWMWVLFFFPFFWKAFLHEKNLYNCLSNRS